MQKKEFLLSALKENALQLTSRTTEQTDGMEAVRFIRRDSNRKFGCVISRPSFALVVNGKKQALVGETSYEYGSGCCLLTGSSIPDSFVAIDASKENPFLAISVGIEPHLCDWTVSYLSEKYRLPYASENSKIFSLYEADEALLSVFLNLTEAALTPGTIKLFEEIIKKELYLRVLTSPLGSLFLQMYMHGSVESRIRRTSDWLSEHFKHKIDNSVLAEKAGMSQAAFYRHFKTIVGMTPSQLVRNLRLTEAKRLMLEEKIDANTACFKVGYESPTYFNREFKNLFGETPSRHVRSILAQCA